jgi:hypothetical protein
MATGQADCLEISAKEREIEREREKKRERERDGQAPTGASAV